MGAMTLGYAPRPQFTFAGLDPAILFHGHQKGCPGQARA
jgi:hypothetical protein